jgi:hypothetical protein
MRWSRCCCGGDGGGRCNPPVRIDCGWGLVAIGQAGWTLTFAPGRSSPPSEISRARRVCDDSANLRQGWGCSATRTASNAPQAVAGDDRAVASRSASGEVSHPKQGTAMDQTAPADPGGPTGRCGRADGHLEPFDLLTVTGGHSRGNAQRGRCGRDQVCGHCCRRADRWVWGGQ